MTSAALKLAVALLLASQALCAGEQAASKQDAVTTKLAVILNTNSFTDDEVAAEVCCRTTQASATGNVEFSTKLHNRSARPITIRVGAFLDTMGISLTSATDKSIALAANVRSRINADILPARPYRITAWRILSNSPQGDAAARELPIKLLQEDDPKALRKETLEVPPSSTLVMHYEIHTLEKRELQGQGSKIKQQPVAPGSYTLSLSMLLSLATDKGVHDYSSNMQFKLERPMQIQFGIADEGLNAP